MGQNLMRRPPPYCNGFIDRHGKPRWAAGLHGCSAHGLRKAAARRLAEAGCSTHETGHASLKEVARYTEAVDRRRLAQSAMAKVRTLSDKPDERFVKKG